MFSRRTHVPMLLIILGLACMHHCHNSFDRDSEDSIGQCDQGNQCTECYRSLVESLLSRDQNLFNLSKTFFPAHSNDRPQFVSITYRFNGTNDTRVWYWSEKGSYFIYPQQTFEYLSLFFGKASAFFAGTVTVTLDEECLYAEHFMHHLTQRVSESRSAHQEIDLYCMYFSWEEQGQRLT